MFNDWNWDAEVGYNFKTLQFENLKESGVIDPTLVLKNAITNAVGIVSNFFINDWMYYTMSDYPRVPKYDQEHLIMKKTKKKVSVCVSVTYHKEIEVEVEGGLWWSHPQLLSKRSSLSYA